MSFRSNGAVMLWAALTVATLAPMALSQPASSSPDPEGTISGMVVSSSQSTIVVRTDQGAYRLFAFDKYTVKPRTIPVGSAVRVLSTPGTEPDMRHATDIIITTPAPTTQTKETKETKESAEAIPASVRRLEEDMARQTRKYGAGIRAGVGLDPEVLVVGVQARLGPVFNRSLSFRPNIELGWGEVTTLIAVNLDGVYRLPFTPSTGRWSAYVGGGPTLGFSHRNFEEAAAGEGGIDFGDLDFNGGLNILAGIEYRSGLFFELKTTVYTSPHLRLIVGYTF